jgi:site-specific DNA-methyltransferase (adenine-specific)
MSDSPSWSVITSDCIAEMKRMEPGSARLVFADPPYNIGVDYGDGFDDKRSPAEYLAWSRRWIGAAARLLTPDGSLWLLVNHEWSADLFVAMREAGPRHRQTITWYETFGVNCTAKFNRCSRPLFHMTRHPRRFVFNRRDPEIRRPSDREAVYKDKRAKNPKRPKPPGKLHDDVWIIPRLAETHAERRKTPDGETAFPTQLPIRLLRRVVACASQPGNLVVDPFNGSGTTGAACIELGRRYVGIEASGRFAEMARCRLEGITPGLAIA